jgi:DNA polymerase-3 subunit gamma/tau
MVEHLRALLLIRLGSGIVPAHISDDLRRRVEEQAAEFTPRALARAVRLFNQAATEAKGGWHPQLPLEMAFVEATLASEEDGSGPIHRNRPAPAKSGPSPSPRHSASSSSASAVSRPARARSAPSPSPPPARAVRESESAYHSPTTGESTSPALTIETLRDRWPEVLNALRPRNLSLEALMRSCRPVAVEGDVIVLGFDYDFHRGKVEEEQNRQDVEEALGGLVGRRYRVRCVLAKDVQQERPVVSSQRPGSDSGGGKTTSPMDQIIADDPVVRAAVEDLGAQIVQQG